MHRFFCESMNSGTTHVTLNEVESHHACRVLRMSDGDLLELIDGKGILASARIVVPHHKRCEVEILGQHFSPESPNKIHLAICPTKSNDRFEWMLEKAVEIGVDEITPLISENSERSKLNFERLDKVILSAVKQSLRMYIPQLNPPKKVKKFIEEHPNSLIAHCDSQFERVELNSSKASGHSCIMIGPEGDFSLNEIQWALQHNLKTVSLGNNRLRTETAGLVAVTILNAMRS